MKDWGEWPERTRSEEEEEERERWVFVLPPLEQNAKEETQL